MRRVAETLGCSPMAICRHISGKDELLAGLMDRLIERRPRPDLPDDPRERLVALICWQHDGLAEVPWVLDAIAGGAGSVLRSSGSWRGSTLRCSPAA